MDSRVSYSDPTQISRGFFVLNVPITSMIDERSIICPIFIFASCQCEVGSIPIIQTEALIDGDCGRSRDGFSQTEGGGTRGARGLAEMVGVPGGIKGVDGGKEGEKEKQRERGRERESSL